MEQEVLYGNDNDIKYPKYTGLDTVEVGQLIEARVDMVLGNETTTW